jgi:uncharacterized membrane protein
MIPPGFLGTEADLLIDIVVCSLAAILPTMGYAVYLVRQGRYVAHRNVMAGLYALLFVVVLLFEADLQAKGGIFELTKDSAYAGTALLNGSVWVHTSFSFSTSILWTGLVASSLWKLRPPRPGPNTRLHRILGKVSMAVMAATCITGLELYIVGFVY